MLLLAIFCMVSILRVDAQINTRKYFYNGRLYLYNEEYTNAIRTFNIILSYHPDEAKAFFLRGYAKYQLSDYSGAISDYNTAIELDRFLIDALYYRAIANIELNNFNSALKDLNSAINVDDRHARYYVTRGYLNSEFGDTISALKDYKRAVLLDPENQMAYLNLSVLQMELGDYNTAFENCEKAEELNPADLQTLLVKGNINQHMEKYALAIEQYQKIIERDSNNIRAFYFMATSYQELEKIDSALYYYKKALALNPDNSVCYYQRAILNIEIEKYKNAISDLNRVIDLNPRNIYSYYLRGVAKINLKEYNGAEDDFTKAIKLYPLLVDAYRSRAFVRGSKNNMVGYFQDVTAVDSLLKLGGEEHAKEDLDYFKSITDFRSDFTNVADAGNKKVQYLEQTIRMLSIYHPTIFTPDSVNTKQISIDKYIDYSEIELPLTLVNYDYSDLSDFEIADLKEKIDDALSENPNSFKYNLLKSLVLGWQMEYSFANSVIHDITSENSDELMLYFIEANHSYFIASVMSSFDIKHFVIDKSEQVNYSSKRDVVANEHYEYAIENYDKAIELDSDFIYSYYNRAYVNSLLMNYNDAINDYTHCIEKEPNFAEALYNRGLLYVYLNKDTRGCKDLSKAGELGVDNAYRVIYKYCKD